jgi:hypothetical protein
VTIQEELTIVLLSLVGNGAQNMGSAMEIDIIVNVNSTLRKRKILQAPLLNLHLDRRKK